MQQPADPESLSALAQQVLSDMQDRRVLIESGQARFLRAFGRPVDDAERVTLEPPIVDVTDAPVTSWPTVVSDRKHPIGQLWVTDRRAVVAHRSRVLRAWSWGELRDVRIIPGYLGVVFTPFDGETVTVVRQTVADRRGNPDRAACKRWLTVEATHAAATGRLDEWYAELPARLAGDETAGSALIAPMMRDLLSWSERFEVGGISDPEVNLMPGERVAVRVPGSAAVGALDRGHGMEYVKRYADGDVVATDQRLLVLDGDSVVLSWTWATDMGEGSMLGANGHGALFLPSDARHAEGARHLLGVVPRAVLEKGSFAGSLYIPMVAAWSRVVAAYRLSRDDLETWREEIRATLGAHTDDS
ncbi:MAG TPA: hypothetical protein VHW92_04050 [Mycobacteriales bacterium]|jgi:hypothetical protein|nr:hypothetical protein [Mycobacteriales bacterium]